MPRLYAIHSAEPTEAGSPVLLLGHVHDIRGREAARAEKKHHQLRSLHEHLARTHVDIAAIVLDGGFLARGGGWVESCACTACL